MSGELSVGCLVKIKNLKSRTDLNGRCAKVLSFSSDSGRWECELLAPGGLRDGGYIKCLPANLDLALPSSAQGGGGMPPPAKRMRMGDEDPTSIDGNSTEFKLHVNSFVAHPLLQPHAAAQFLALSPDQQWQIMQRGTLAEARDPTAVLISRMNSVRGSSKFSTTAPTPRTGSVDYSRLDSPAPEAGLACRSAEESFTQPVQSQVFALGSPAYPETTAEPTAVDAGVAFFLAQPLLSQAVKQQFLSLSFQQQMQVMRNGSLLGHKDPNAVLMSRINGASIGQAAPWQPARQPQAAAPLQVPDMSQGSGDMQAFLQQQGVQTHAIMRFQNLTSDQQQQVLSLGALHHARDPTAVFISRMQKVETVQPSKFGAGPQGGMGF